MDTLNGETEVPPQNGTITSKAPMEVQVKLAGVERSWSGVSEWFF